MSGWELAEVQYMEELNRQPTWGIEEDQAPPAPTSSHSRSNGFPLTTCHTSATFSSNHHANQPGSYMYPPQGGQTPSCKQQSTSGPARGIEGRLGNMILAGSNHHFQQNQTTCGGKPPTGINAREEKCNNSGGINFNAYEDIPVEIIGENVPPPIETFADMGCADALKMNIRTCGYVRPTPVQRNAIPICMGGRDLMACAQTGSGKTAAFCLPIIASMLRSHDACHVGPTAKAPMNGVCCPLALILSPTRELASQIHAEARKFAQGTGLPVVVVYGGTPIRAQISDLKRGAAILVATPGRLDDLIGRGNVSLADIKHLVIDEADRMLDMGFEPQIRRIVDGADMPPAGKRQTMLFSATFPHEIQALARRFLAEYVFISVGRVGSSTGLITQKVEYVEESDKRNWLKQLIQAHEFNSSGEGKQLMVIFAETKRRVDELEMWLCRMGWKATSIHGDRTQWERESALRTFKSGKTPILVATDVAARGLDVPEVAHVVNYDLPNDIDGYVHRIGRTGRAGRTGIATAFFNDKNIALAKSLVDLLAESMQEVPQWLAEHASVESTSRGCRRIGHTRSRGASRMRS